MSQNNPERFAFAEGEKQQNFKVSKKKEAPDGENVNPSEVGKPESPAEGAEDLLRQELPEIERIRELLRQIKAEEEAIKNRRERGFYGSKSGEMSA